MHGTAYAQVDLWGEWALRMHEDQPWRGPRQLPGEWRGLPINAEARESRKQGGVRLHDAGAECIPFSVDMLTDGIYPIWAPDGKSVVFTAARSSGVYAMYSRALDRSGDDLLLATATPAVVNDFSRDGRFIV